jgi:hypothetical protein
LPATARGLNNNTPEGVRFYAHGTTNHPYLRKPGCRHAGIRVFVRPDFSAGRVVNATIQLPMRRRTAAELNVVLAVTGDTQLARQADADVRVVGRQIRAKAHQVLYRDRGKRCTVAAEIPEGAYSQLPVWSHPDQWLYLVQLAATAWFPEQIHRQVRVVTLLKFAALVAAVANDQTGRDCWRPYPELARDMGVSVETVRKCWRALERLGLAVQVARSVCFPYDERMRIWRLERSKQRGLTPVYALVVPAAYAQALTTGEHPGDLLAQAFAGEDGASATGETLMPSQKLSAALRKLQTTGLPAAAPAVAQEAPVAAEDGSEASLSSSGGQVAAGPVDNSREHPFKKLEKVDILGLPRSGPRCSFAAACLLVGVVPHGVKSTASRAHNRDGGADSGRSGGSGPRKHAQKRCTSQGRWFGVHRDIAVALTRRVVWMKGTEPGKLAGQFQRFTVPGLPKIWTPDDFVTAMDRINLRQNRYSPGANQASGRKADQQHAQRADAGAVRAPMSMLKWYLDQLDPVNDHPRFELDVPNEQIRSSWIGLREAVTAENEQLAAIGMERGSQRRAEIRAQRVAEARRLMGAPPVTSPRNRR